MRLGRGHRSLSVGLVLALCFSARVSAQAFRNEGLEGLPANRDVQLAGDTRGALFRPKLTTDKAQLDVEKTDEFMRKKRRKRFNRPTENVLEDPEGELEDKRVDREKDYLEDDEEFARYLESQKRPVAEVNLFQKFVKDTKQKRLPIFGESLFKNEDAFEERQMAPVPSEYVIGPGDEILLKIYGSAIDFDQRLVVDRQGMVVLPKVGPFSVAGVKVGDLSRLLKSRISKVLSNFNLFVSMGQLRGIEVYVVGQAVQPGKYVVSSLSTVINALFITGGPSKNGTLRNVQLIRDSKVIASVDLYDFIAKGDTSKDKRLLSGDVISIGPVGPQVALMGAVASPGIYELKTGSPTPIKEILTLAGGLSSQTSIFQGSLERIASDKSKPLMAQTMTMDESGMNTEMKAGDILTLYPIKATFDNTVTLRIMQADPIRVPITGETRVRDVIPSKEVLLTSDYYLRKFEGSNPKLALLAKQDLKGRLRIAQADQVNWDQAVIERINPQNFTSQVISFDLAKAIEGDADNNIVLQSGDVISVFSQLQVELPLEKKTQVVLLQGEVARPGLYQIQYGETLDALISRAGGLTPNAYIYGAELSRLSVKARQRDNIRSVIRQLESRLRSNLSAAASSLSSPASDKAAVSTLAEQNTQAVKAQIARLETVAPQGRVFLEVEYEEPKLPAFKLEDGDEVLLPPVPGYISVVGSVNNENVFMYKPERRVSDYLKVAGLTDQADRDALFVLRANGAIISSDDHNVQRATLYPGDTVVVPEKNYQESGYSVFMRGLKDWTQVIFQLGLSASAIHVLSK